MERNVDLIFCYRDSPSLFSSLSSQRPFCLDPAKTKLQSHVCSVRVHVRWHSTKIYTWTNESGVGEHKAGSIRYRIECEIASLHIQCDREGSFLGRFSCSRASKQCDHRMGWSIWTSQSLGKRGPITKAYTIFMPPSVPPAPPNLFVTKYCTIPQHRFFSKTSAENWLISYLAEGAFDISIRVAISLHREEIRDCSEDERQRFVFHILNVAS